MKMTLIVLCALVATVLLRRRSAALRHWVLATGVACAALVPLLGTVMPAWPLPFGTPAAFVSYDRGVVTAPASPSARPDTAAGAVAASPQTVPVASGPARSEAARWLTAAWIAGASLSLAILLVGMLRLMWLAIHAERLTTGRWVDLATEISGTYGLRRSVVLLRSRHPSLLVTWGVARPKVILPATADEWSDERARVVMSHELAHIRRGDWIVQLSAELLRACYWFNPLMWVACRRLRLESEHACDDEVMNRGVDGADYATHLVELARALNARHAWLPAPAMARRSSLERRVRAMLNRRLDREPITTGTRAATFVLLFALTAAVAAAQSGYASFTGRVTDEQGRTVQGVAVGLANEARQSKYEVKTNDAGRFEFVGLPAGDYTIEVRGIGFQLIKDALTISGKDAQRNFTMMLGRLQETITIRSTGTETGTGSPDTPTIVAEVPMPPARECTPSDAGGRIVPPKKIRDARPYYPSALRGTVTVGTVQLEARIGVDGYVSDVRLIGDAQPDLAQSAIAAVREWRYTQTLLNCTPVEVVMAVTINFNPPQKTASSSYSTRP
jgi:beta-lactamase regulating signal transducer with metallopeptidase domain